MIEKKVVKKKKKKDRDQGVGYELDHSGSKVLIPLPSSHGLPYQSVFDGGHCRLRQDRMPHAVDPGTRKSAF